MKFVDDFNIMIDATNLFRLFEEIIEWSISRNIFHIVANNYLCVYKENEF